MPMLPDCAWHCGTALPDSARICGTEGDNYFICPCCSKTTRVDRQGIAHPQGQTRRVEQDVSGNQIYGD